MQAGFINQRDLINGLLVGPVQTRTNAFGWFYFPQGDVGAQGSKCYLPGRERSLGVDEWNYLIRQCDRYVTESHDLLVMNPRKSPIKAHDWVRTSKMRSCYQHGGFRNSSEKTGPEFSSERVQNQFRSRSEFAFLHSGTVWPAGQERRLDLARN